MFVNFNICKAFLYKMCTSFSILKQRVTSLVRNFPLVIANTLEVQYTLRAVILLLYTSQKLNLNKGYIFLETQLPHEAASDSNCVTSAKGVLTNTVLVTPTAGSHELQSCDFL
jgi:hypothetical protein